MILPPDVDERLDERARAALMAWLVNVCRVCPRCFGKLAIRTSKRTGGRRVCYLRCRACGLRLKTAERLCGTQSRRSVPVT